MTEIQGGSQNAGSRFMYTGVFGYQVTGTLSSETVTVSWTSAAQAAVWCQPWSHAKNLLTLTKGVDYAANTVYNTNSTDASITLTTIGTSNSMMVGAAETWAQHAITAGANTTFKQSNASAGYTGYTTAAVSAGSNTWGGTVTADYNYLTAVELLGQ